MRPARARTSRSVLLVGGFPCRVVTDGVVMLRDAHHQTNTHAATRRPAIGTATDHAFG